MFGRSFDIEIFGMKFNNTIAALTAVVFPSANQNRDKSLAGGQTL